MSVERMMYHFPLHFPEKAVNLWGMVVDMGMVELEGVVLCLS